MAERRHLDELIERLERAANGLRAGELGPQRAAELVEECARAASEAAAELDRELRAGDAVAPAGQLRLDS